MNGWHYRLSGHEFEETPGDSEGQGSLVCCSPWGHKESDTTEPLKNNLEFPIKLMIKLQALRVVTDLVTHSLLLSFPPLSPSSK